MKSQKTKLLIMISFIILILGMGGLFWYFKLKGHRTVKKQGYRTEFNPSYLDSMVRAKKKH